MHKLFGIHDLTSIITSFISGEGYLISGFPINNDELRLCNIFKSILVVYSSSLLKMKNYHDIENLEIRGEIILFPKKLKCLYIEFAPYHDHENTELKYIFGAVPKTNRQPSQDHEEKMKKIVSWLESIYETLPSSLNMIGFTHAKKNLVMLRSALPKSVKYLNINNGSVINKNILTQLTKIILNNDESIDNFPDNIKNITFTNKKCQQKITKLPKKLKTIDLYANKNHPFKCTKHENYDEHHKFNEFIHNGMDYSIRKNCKEHDFINPMPNITTIITNACIFDADQPKLPKTLTKLIICKCTCGTVNEFMVRKYIKGTNIVVEFRNNIIRSCFRS